MNTRSPNFGVDLTGHPLRFRRQMGMNRFVFRKLLRELERRTGLRPTRHVSTEEQLAIFLRIARTGLSNAEMQERFQRSGETISKYVFWDILSLVLLSSFLISVNSKVLSPNSHHARIQGVLHYLCPPSNK